MKSFAFGFACLLAGVSAVQAAGVGAEKATEMLAHAWMIDNRCQVLDKVGRDQLTDLVARAEISLAEKQSVKAATAAIGRGRASGTVAPCDAKSADAVKKTLQVASSAVAVSEMDAQPGPSTDEQLAPEPVAAAPLPEKADEPMVAQSEAEEPSSEPDAVNAPVIAVRKVMSKPRKVKPVVAAKTKPKIVRPATKREQPITLAAATRRQPAANGYGQTAESYYRELRCRKLSSRAVNAMYARVLREHRRAVSANGKAAIRQLLRAAEARASSGSC